MSKLLIPIFATLLTFGAVASEPPKETQQNSSVKSAKRPRKVGICSTCGKPETKCECDDEKDKDGKPEASEQAEKREGKGK